jgi:cobalt/nickel transport system ATP-binding protein
MNNQNTNNIIKIENVNYSYYGMIPALSGINLNINDGEICAIIGSNGCGKSTLMHIMNGLIFPDSGNIYFNNREITEKSLREKSFLKIFRENVGYVFQNSDIQLFCQTVLDELIFGPLQLGLTKDEAYERAMQVFEMLNIKYLKDRSTLMLSGGEKKRVAIGSVLTMNPRVLLLDEPASGLDPKTQSFLVELAMDLNQAGKTIVIATHDLALIDDLKPRVVVLSEEHSIEASGNASDILQNTELLVKVNLIHEHRHRHDKETHKHPHSHYFFHKH